MISTKCVQANLHHAKGASVALMERIAREGLEIALLQEPWIHNKRVCGLASKKGNLIYDRKSERPRAAILINRSIDYIPLTQFISSDLVAISVTYGPEGSKKEIIIASGYFPGEETEAPPRDTQLLIEHCRKTKTPYLLGCDANAHHTLWGSSDINDRGESLLEFCLVHEVQIVNRGNKPTFANAIREEVLDLTLCDNSVVQQVTNWHVSDEESLSDHRHLRFDICELGASQGTQYSRKLVNWESFSILVAEESKYLPTAINSISEIEQVNSVMTDMLISAHQSCSKVVKEKNIREVPWWNPELGKQRKNVRKLFNRAKANGDWASYKLERNSYNNNIQEAKRKEWERFCSELEGVPEAARLHKLLSKDNTNGIGMLKRSEGGITANREEVLEELLKTHFPESKDKESYTYQSIEPRYTERKRAWSNSGNIFTPEKVDWAVRSFHPLKAPGGDQIFPALLQKSLEHIRGTLTLLFRASYTWAYIPEGWRKVNVVFLPKPGKTGDNAKSYRPISLSSFILKTMEKMLDLHIRGTLAIHRPIHKSQFAYSKGKSTELALSLLTEKIERTLRFKEFALGAFLDVEGAFDNTGYGAIINALQTRLVDKATQTWTLNMLGGRMITSKIGSTSRTILATKGCPQGGVLSPLLWTIVVDDLLIRLTERGFVVFGYADDVAIYTTGKFETTVRERLVEALALVNRWCREIGLNVNPAKSIIVPFTKRRKFNKEPIPFGETHVQLCKEVKYLGVTLDSTLNWNHHIDNICNKAMKSLWISTSYCGRGWGLTPAMMHRLYCMMVRPIVTYAAVVWWTKVDQSTTQLKLNRIQRIACLRITGAMRTTPTAAMEALLGIYPLHIHIQSTAMGSALRSIIVSKRQVTEGHLSIIKKLHNWEYLTTCTDVTVPVKALGNKFSTTILEAENWNIDDLHLERNTSVWYTDGSKTDEGSGYGVNGPRTKKSVSLGINATIFQAELLAIHDCVECIHSHKPKGSSFAILSDSQAVIKSLITTETKSRLVMDCRDSVNELAKHNRVRICWVPGHKGVEGNEIADELARKGASTKLIGPEPACGLNWSSSLTSIKEWSERKRDNHWNQTHLTGGSKRLIKPHARKDILTLPRRDLRNVTGLLTGHNNLRYHLQKMGLSTEITCRLCANAVETSIHVMGECTALMKSRWALTGKIQLGAEELANLDTSTLTKLAKVALSLLV